MLPDDVEWVELYMRIKYDPYVLFLVKLKEKDRYYLTNTTTDIFNPKSFLVRNFRKYETASAYLSKNYYALVRGRVC